MNRTKNRFRACVTALATAAACLLSPGSMNAFAADGAGGYSWEKTEGYQVGTESVTDAGEKTVVSFKNADQGDNVAGFCTQSGDGWDWSDYTTLSFTLTNDGTDTIGFQIALGTGADWSWYQTTVWTTLGGGESVDLTYYLKAEEWALNGGKTISTVPDLYAVHRLNMMVMPAEQGKTITGSVTVSDLKLGGSASASVEPKDGFYVDGAVLRDANQNPFIMRGTNYAYTWYKWDGKTEAALKEIADYGGNCVRIVLGDGDKYDKNTSGEIAHLIEECEKNKLIAVFEVHDATGENSEQPLLNAANYFAKDIAGALKGHEDSVIINIANEWQGSANDSAWQSAYIKAVNVLRDAGLKHCIMCDAGGWGQTASTVINGGAAVLAADPEHNTMFSVHMYGYAGGTESMIKNIMDSMITRELCLVIGEFGWKHSDGDVQEAYIMEYAQQTGTGWMAWSWYGNSGGVEYLDMSNANAGGTLSPEWGEVIINGENGWKATAKPCTVFTQDGPSVTTTASATTTTVIETTTLRESTTTITTTVSETTTTVSETTAPLDPGKKGDVDESGMVDVSDAVLLARFLAEDAEATVSQQGAQNADVNGSGKPDSEDTVMILKAIARLITL